MTTTNTINTISKDSDPQPLLDRFFQAFASVTLINFLIAQVLLFSYGSKVCHDESFITELLTRDIKVFVSGAFVVQLSLLAIRLFMGVSY
jgi:hypothetical protein